MAWLLDMHPLAAISPRWSRMPRSACNFLWCLATGVLIRNGGARLGLKLDDRATEIIGTVALSLFLGMTMMTLDLSSVARPGRWR